MGLPSKKKATNKNKVRYKKLFSLLLAAFAISIAQAQEKTDGLPITLEVVTVKAYTDGAVRLQGTSTSLDNDPGQVTIEVKKPDGSIDKLSIRADKETGNFFIKYIPKAVGDYKATAFSPDKLQTASAEFSVEMDWDKGEEITAAQKEAEKTLTAIETFTNSLFSGNQLSQEEIATTKQKIKTAKDKLGEYKNALAQIKEGFDHAKKIVSKYPEFGPYVRMPEKAGAINSTLDEQTKELKNIQQRFSPDKLKGADVCGRLFALSEGCALFSTVMNFKSTNIISIIKNIAIDKAWPKFYDAHLAPKKILDDNENFLAKQAGKAFATAEGKLSNLASFDYKAGVVGDLTQYISDQVLKKLCTEYSGELTGEYAMEFKNNGKRYMYYKYKYVGKISLLARKDGADKEGANFSGYLEGNINNVDFDDDIWAVEDKSQWQQEYYRRLKMIVVPANLNKNDPGFGAIARQGMPGAFYFPIKGKIEQNKMIIELQPAMMELSTTNANRTAIIVSDPNNPYNRRGVLFTYPTTTAWFILTRTMRMADKNAKAAIPIKKEENKTVIEGNFTRTETPSDTKVDFKLNFKLSND